MPGDVVLDTNVVVAHLRNDKAVTERLRDAGILYISATAAGELWVGVGRAADPVKAAAKLTDFLSIVTLLPVEQKPPSPTARSNANWPRLAVPFRRTTSGLPPVRCRTPCPWRPVTPISRGSKV